MNSVFNIFHIYVDREGIMRCRFIPGTKRNGGGESNEKNVTGSVL